MCSYLTIGHKMSEVDASHLFTVTTGPGFGSTNQWLICEIMLGGPSLQKSDFNERKDNAHFQQQILKTGFFEWGSNIQLEENTNKYTVLTGGGRKLWGKFKAALFFFASSIDFTRSGITIKFGIKLDPALSELKGNLSARLLLVTS